jgi:hypothetical protein
MSRISTTAKTLVAAAALGIAGAATVQAAEIFTCSGLGYGIHNGKIERVCTTPVTTHWTELGGALSHSVFLDKHKLYRSDMDR